MKHVIKLVLLTGLAATTIWAGGDRDYRYRNSGYRDYGYGRQYKVKVKKFKGPGKAWRGNYNGPGYYAPSYHYRARARRPGPRYIWVDPYRDWRGPAYGYVWAPGRWVIPPRPQAVWVDGFWSPRGGGAGIWVSAHWR